ncbi:hypothetical protein FM076_00020 [Streptomyces albus subsp. chlorinus]|nr:hypothetical protein [Streptomyces albus subsp. chlorinus]
MTGGPLDGRRVSLHPVQEQEGRWGSLIDRRTPYRDRPAHLRDGTGRWLWQGKPWPEERDDA